MKIIVVLCIILSIFTGCSRAEAKDIPKDKMIKRVLKDCKISPEENMSITSKVATVLYGQENVIFTLNLGPKKNLMAVYEKKGSKYYFLGKVDIFMDLEEIQIMPLRSNISNLIVVRERADQILGAMEDGIYIRAYTYDGKNFAQVLSVIEDYKAYTLQPGHNWKRVAQKAQIVWENEFYPTINILQSQNYAEAPENSDTTIPADDKFDILKNREIKSRYQWSDTWNHFILGTGVEKPHNKKAAIIMDWSETPFGLVDEFKIQTERYLIKYPDGSLKNVKKDDFKKD